MLKGEKKQREILDRVPGQHVVGGSTREIRLGKKPHHALGPFQKTHRSGGGKKPRKKETVINTREKEREDIRYASLEE